MIFIALLLLVPLTIATFAIRRRIRGRYHVDGAGYFLVAALGTIALAVGLAAGAEESPASYTEVYERAELRALNTGSQPDGAFFLGSGVIDEERMLFFIAERDGFSYLDEAPADRSRIVEGVESPEMRKVIAFADHWWLAPFPVMGEMAYEFHVPAGSVLEQFEVTP